MRATLCDLILFSTASASNIGAWYKNVLLQILVNGTGTLTGGQFSGARSRSCNVCKKETGTADTGPITRSASGMLSTCHTSYLPLFFPSWPVAPEKHKRRPLVGCMSYFNQNRVRILPVIHEKSIIDCSKIPSQPVSTRHQMCLKQTLLLFSFIF